ncbi:SRPBCC family protein [Hyphomicrobium sp. 2TAF46]|uniref:SRPBCC family protein n=1 Tax=Hyphomicrobium sp. 2TAF46 TaxID=3233019 RepID=UPI003F90C33F
MPIKFRLLLAFAALSACAGNASAHGPTPQKVEEKIAISAPPAAVWQLIKDFGSIGTWHPSVASVKSEGGNGSGATRTLTLKSGGGELVESLDDYQEKDMSYGYRLATENDDAFPASFYSDTIQVVPASGGSEVVWGSRFYRADTTNEPPENKNDEAAIKATEDFIKAGLAGIKAKAEGKG